jgi:hypothetical protein
VRGAYRLHPYNPTVFHDADPASAVAAESDTLSLLWAPPSGKQEALWARQQRLFLLGDRPPLPNLFDDGAGVTKRKPKDSRKRQRAAASSSSSFNAPGSAQHGRPSPPADKRELRVKDRRAWFRYCIQRMAQDTAASGAAADSESNDALDIHGEPAPVSGPEQGLQPLALSNVLGRRPWLRSARAAAAAAARAERLAAAGVLPSMRRGWRLGRYLSLVRLADDLAAHVPAAVAASDVPTPHAAASQLLREVWSEVQATAAAAAAAAAASGSDPASALSSPAPASASAAVLTPQPSPHAAASATATAATAAAGSGFGIWHGVAPVLSEGVRTWAAGLFHRDEDDAANDGTGSAAGDTPKGADAHSHGHGQGKASSGNDNACSKCFGSGDLVCCDRCPRAYHLSCLGISQYDLPHGAWFCPACKAAARAARRGSLAAVATSAADATAAAPPASKSSLAAGAEFNEHDINVLLAVIAAGSKHIAQKRQLSDERADITVVASTSQGVPDSVGASGRKRARKTLS